MTHRTPIRAFVATALISIALVSSLPISNAAQTADVPQKAVHYGDLVMANPEAAQALYHRIASAATTVCRSLDDSSLESMPRFRACIVGAIANAVKKVDQPALTAIFNAKHPEANPIQLAAR